MVSKDSVRHVNIRNATTHEEQIRFLKLIGKSHNIFKICYLEQVTLSDIETEQFKKIKKITGWNTEKLYQLSMNIENAIRSRVNRKLIVHDYQKPLYIAFGKLAAKHLGDLPNYENFRNTNGLSKYWGKYKDDLLSDVDTCDGKQCNESDYAEIDERDVTLTEEPVKRIPPPRQAKQAQTKTSTTSNRKKRRTQNKSFQESENGKLYRIFIIVE